MQPTTPNPDAPLDRRPLKSRSWPVMARLASALAVRRVSPNLISVLGMLAACGSGLALAFTTGQSPTDRALFALAAMGMQLRLVANLIDGMVAVEGGMKSAVGDLYNEVPDRVSDTAVLIGAGYAIGSVPVLGWAAACGALLVTYVRVLGKGVGLIYDYRGPMAKQQRMAVLTASCLWMAASPAAWQPRVAVGSGVWGVMAFALAVVVAGCIITAWRRLAWVAQGLRQGLRA